MKAEEFIPVEGQENHYTHPTLGLCALAVGMTLEEFIDSIENPTELVAPKRKIAKSVIISRLIEANKIGAARAVLDSNDAAYARWWAPDRPAIYYDDPEALALLTAIGADPEIIMAP
jgi:hypothetical protein